MEALLHETLGNLLQLALLALLGLGGMLITKGLDMLGVKKDAAIRSYLYDGLYTALHYADEELRRRIDSGAVTLAAAANVRLELARGFVLDHFGDALRHFSVDTMALDRMLLARVDAAPVSALADVVPAASTAIPAALSISPGAPDRP